MTELEEFDRLDERPETLLERIKLARARRRVWKGLRERQRTHFSRGNRADRIARIWTWVGVACLFMASILGLLLLLGPLPE